VDGLVKLLVILLEARIVRLDRLRESGEVGFDEELWKGRSQTGGEER
jgi:hypothetical protein